MGRDADQQKLFTRRAMLLAGGQGLLLSVLAGRLYYLQVVETERYATLADENRINLRLLAPPRGRIFDRHGRPLAVNRRNYRVVLVAEQSGDVEGIMDVLEGIIEISEGDRRRILAEVRRKRKFVPVTIREDLDWEEVARVEVNAPDLPGLAIEEGESRQYLYGAELAHVLGYVAPVSEDELNGDPLLEQPGFRTGKAGIEKIYDAALRGVSGSSQVEVNSVGRVIRELDHRDGRPGADLNLTMDFDLQQLAADRLAGQSGAIVLLDVQMGDVLALASMPGYDPNAFNRGLTVDEWQALIADPKAPLINKAIGGLYAPGSTFKPVTALAALENGDISPDTTVTCTGRMRLGTSTFHCWKRGGHGTVDLRAAIIQSCDIFFYETAKRVGVDRIAAMGRRLGLGTPPGLDFPAERGGVLPTRDWKLATTGIPWQKGETLVAGIGQGYVLTTPLQLAVMTARIANGGLEVIPRLVSERKESDGTIVRAPVIVRGLGLNPAHLRAVQEGMVGVVNHARGTARQSAITEPGMQMAGKTGTAQVRRITKSERESGVIKNEDLPWERRDHALFIGYAPVDAPRYAVAVVVEHGGSGSQAAAPLARDMLLAAQRSGGVPIAQARRQDRRIDRS